VATNGRAPPRSEHLRNQLLGAPIAIHISRIDEAYACIQGSVQGGLGILRRDVTHEPPMAQAPNPISETSAPVRPKRLDFMQNSL
jgi:hypothetical protein